MSNNADADAAARAEALSKMSNAARAFYALDSSVSHSLEKTTQTCLQKQDILSCCLVAQDAL